MKTKQLRERLGREEQLPSVAKTIVRIASDIRPFAIDGERAFWVDRGGDAVNRACVIANDQFACRRRLRIFKFVGDVTRNPAKGYFFRGFMSSSCGSTSRAFAKLAMTSNEAL